MPIYEFLCARCNVLCSFFARSAGTSRKPACPHCGGSMEKQISAFAMTGHAQEGGDGDLPIDDARMERAIEALAGEAERIDENNPKQAADLMRKFSRMTGMEFGAGMDEAISRMEAGEDPESVEADLGDVMESEEPFQVSDGAPRRRQRRRPPGPSRDPKLYEL
ncbi:MAG: zinc ribbon domain-containing protein [Lentisphaerae bacterium]|nr:zinc ribbon domain-containing protein [Lentisphaerota bacterium]